MTLERQSYNVGGVELARPFKLRRLGHFALWQDDLAAARRFYVDLLGLRRTDDIRDADGSHIVMFAGHGTDHHSFVAVSSSYAAGIAKENLAKGIRVNQASFQVGTLSEVAEAHAFFIERKVPIVRMTRDFPGSNWALYILDPDGHRLELYYGMEQLGWSRRSKPEAAYLPQPMAVPSLPQPAEIQEVAAAIEGGVDLLSGDVHEETQPFDFVVGGICLPRPFKVAKVGPVSLFVEDVERSERFYLDLLGMEKTEEVVWRGHRCVYLRVGSDHHTVALIPKAVREELGLDHGSSLLSFGVEMGSYEQLRDAVDFLKGKGVAFSEAVPPELHPGIDYAAYAVADDGHLIQLYFGIEQIGWDGRPRPASERRKVAKPWPETIVGTSESYAGHVIQGPMA